MAVVLKINPIDGLWYETDGINPVTNPAALFGIDGGVPGDGLSLVTLTTSPPISDVVCPRSITFDLAGSPGVTITVVEDGGKLDFTLNVDQPPKDADLSGLFFDFTHSKLATLKANGPQITQFLTGTGSVINLKNSVNLNGIGVPNFDVGMEFGMAGIGSDNQNIQSEKFVLSDAAGDLSINDLHPTGETGNVGVRSNSGGEKLVAVAPYAPTATPDTVTTPEDVSITIPVTALATDLNAGAILTIHTIGSAAQGPQYGTVTVAADGKSLIYTPTKLDYEVGGILTGNKDAFQVCVTDNFGGEVTSFVTVNATPVADAPKFVGNIALPQAGDPKTLIRFDANITSGDFNTITEGSDFIKSLALSLTGNPLTPLTITDSAGLLAGGLITSGLITPPTNQGLFTDEILVSLPAGSKFSDTLSMTGTNAETENPGITAATTISQTITADSETTPEDTPITISISNLGVSGKITAVAPGPLGPSYGTVSIAGDGQSLTYTPTTLDYKVNGVLAGNQDVFQVYSSNGPGNNAVTLLTVNATPVADKPSLLTVSVGPGASAADMLFTITVNSGDFGTSQAGSDFIQSLQLDLMGNVTSGVTLSDSLGLLNPVTDTITTTGMPGTFTDVIDVSGTSLIGTNTNLDDTLNITAVNAETEAPGTTASSSDSKPILIDFSQATDNPTFTTQDQNIWGPGNAFQFNYSKFLGISDGNGGLKTFGGKIGGVTTPTLAGASLGMYGATAHGSLSLKMGFQADVNINGGSFNATLPFDVTLNDTYNKTTDSLTIGATETAGTGSLDTTGPGGSFGLKAIFDAMASVGGELCFVTCAGDTINIGPVNFSKGISFNSSNLKTSFNLGPATINLTWPQVNTSGTGTTSISSSNMAQALGVSVDVVQAILDALVGGDPLKGSIPGVLTYNMLSAILSAGLDLQQNFNLTDNGLNATLLVGTTQTPEALNLNGTPTTIQNVSLLGLDNTGAIPLSLTLAPKDPTLQNMTNIVPTAGASLTVGQITAGPLKGHLFQTSITVPLGSFNVFSNTFAIPSAFQPQTHPLTVA